MTEHDIDFCDRVRQLAGWNQTTGDWKRFLNLSPDGCFIAERAGIPAGTITTIAYGTRIGWIGMLLVHPDFRRRGIATILLERSIQSLRERNVKFIKLDATPDGAPLYRKMGFSEEWNLARWELTRTAQSGLSGVQAGTPPVTLPVEDLTKIAELDEEAFGGNRLDLLRSLDAIAVSVFEPNGRLEGYGLLTEGARADHIGPVVSSSREIGATLISDLLSHSRRDRIFWDIPGPNRAAQQLAQELGFTVQRPLIRMCLGGPDDAPGKPEYYFAIADPALG